MFTGIIEEVGKVSSIRTEDASIRLQIQTKEILKDIHIGDSIAVNGICLTVTKYDTDSFCADVMHETMNRTSLKLLRRGSKVNLERAMAANGRFGGHIVSGHIDGTGTIRKMQRDSIAIWYTIETTAGILHYIVEKGSITIDGISLTVAAVDDKILSGICYSTYTESYCIAGKESGGSGKPGNRLYRKICGKILAGKEQ